MNAEKVIEVFGAIVTLAMVATIVSSPRTSGIITSLGSAFSNSIKAATGPTR